MAFDNLMDEKVFIKTKSGRQYSGIVTEVHDSGNGLIWISITDRFGKLVMFASSEIEVLEKEVY